jgi:hypothetical protein
VTIEIDRGRAGDHKILKEKSMKATQEGSKLIIEIALQKPKLSASGKSRVVATSRGAWESGIEIEGLPLKILLNAYIDPVDHNNEEPDELSAKPQIKSGAKKQK